MNVLGIITGRGGSKGIPRKNIRLLAGKPLLQYTADAALSAKRLSKVILTTDDAEIAETGRRCGVDVPFLRPPELALDSTPTLPVLQHAVRSLEQTGERYEAVCLLQPTNPFRRAEDIDACIDLFEQNGCDCVISVLRVPEKYNPHWVYLKDLEGRLRLSTGEPAPIPRRQLLPEAFHREGSIYVTRRDTLMQGNSLFGSKVAGYLMDPARSVNIDTMDDWAQAEEFLRCESGVKEEITV
jgi:CMP-N-acetylneuraminic acid synthetase